MSRAAFGRCPAVFQNGHEQIEKKRKGVKKKKRSVPQSVVKPVEHRQIAPSSRDIGLALRAWRRVISIRRQLMKLAPELYDVGVINRLARERAEDEQLQAEMRAAIARVYGVPESDLPPAGKDDFAWKRSARTKRALQRLETEREFWLHIGKVAYERFQSRRPKPWVSLTQIASLLDVASQLGRLATGLETLDRQPVDRPSPAMTFREALQRAYGPGPSAEAAPSGQK